MPPKRKASGAADTSPSKRLALSSVDTPGAVSPSSRTRRAKQPAPQLTVPPTTPKVRRTYGKQTEKGPDHAQGAENAAPVHIDDPVFDAKPGTDPSIHSSKKTRGRRKEVDAPKSPSRRQSKRIKTDPGVRPTTTPPRIRRTHVTKLVVEVPPWPQAKPPSLSLPVSEPSSSSREPPIPNMQWDIVNTTRMQSTDDSILTSKLLPRQFHSCLNLQKKTILQNLHEPARLFHEDDELVAEKTATKHLEDLLRGTITRSEGNSCLLLGPRGSGKSKTLDRCLKALPEAPITIRLSGWIHHTDRLAMREIAYQLGQQTGKSFLRVDEEDTDAFIEQDDNPFLDRANFGIIEAGMALPPPSHLPALISLIPTLSRPTVVILDAFDLFALHPRQALLYCLLDTVQGCRTSMGNKGFVVVGITSRIDTINLLEKRVKSRFSGRVIRTTGIPTGQRWLSLTKRALCPRILGDGTVNEWNGAWNKRVSEFLRNKEVTDAIKDTAGLVNDPKVLFRILIYTVARLSPTSPFPSPSAFSQALSSQRCRSLLYEYLDLPYPALCLVIASIHSITSGHETFNFEMLFSAFRNQLRASVAAPVHVNGGSIGMVRCSRGILLNAFEYLVSCRIFVAAAAPSNTTAKEFARYRTTLERDEVRKIVEKTGHGTLKKWLNKAE